MDKLDQFLAYLKHERYVLPNTIASYKRDISMMLDYFKERNVELENVDHNVIRDFLLTQHKRKLKKTSIYNLTTNQKVGRSKIEFSGFLPYLSISP